MDAAYQVQADNLAVGLLDLLQLGEEVPEAGLGDDIVRGEDAHAVQLRGRVAVRRQMTADDLVFLQACFAQSQRAVLRIGENLRLSWWMDGICARAEAGSSPRCACPWCLCPLFYMIEM